MKSRIVSLALGAAAAVALMGCSGQRSPAPEEVNNVQLREDLEVISKARVLFGHKSVGRNILDGLKMLSEETGVPLRIVAIEGLPPDGEPGLFHAEIGQNGDPEGKCEIFSQLLTRPERPQYDLAMMKFCYVDLGRGARLEAAAMLKRYNSMIEQLAAERPDVTIVHATMPLRADTADWKTPIKRLIGRELDSDPDNVLRNTFNDGLRAKYGNQMFFDLAAVESTLSDGSRSSFESANREIYTLARAYTHDGGHLNNAGKRRVAAELVRVLADAHRRSIQSIDPT